MRGVKGSGISKSTLETLLSLHGSFAEVARTHNMNYGSLKVIAARLGVRNPGKVKRKKTS
jgi:hypothetical protein